jgi:urease accessory protein
MSASVLSLLLADSRTPAGGYAHSGGLEPAVRAGLSVVEVPAFLSARLETVAFVDAAFAAAACAAVAPAGARSSAPLSGVRSTALPELLALDDQLAARVASAPQRAGLRQLGRALLRLGERLWPEASLLAAYGRDSAWTPRPVALGALAGSACLTAVEAARLSLYEDAAGVAAAAVKLLPLDPGEATAWVAGAAGRIEELAGAAAEHGAGSDAATPAAAGAPVAAALPATSTPLLDLRSLDHERLPGRLFVT